VLILLFFEPFIDAMHVELVPASTLNRCAIIAAKLAAAAWKLELVETDGALIVIGIFKFPAPSGNCKPLVNLNFHFE
jgi:hypothetical protein